MDPAAFREAVSPVADILAAEVQGAEFQGVDIMGTITAAMALALVTDPVVSRERPTRACSIPTEPMGFTTATPVRGRRIGSSLDPTIAYLVKRITTKRKRKISR
jgi:hypothetical protein